MLNPFKDTDWNPDLAARRSFARSLVIGFPIIATLFAFSGWLKAHTIPGWTLWLGVGGATAGVVFWVVPQIAKPFYLAWYFIACCMGIVISNALLIAAYYLVFTPAGFLLRLCGRDAMRRRPDPQASTYWRKAEPAPDPARYYRQY
jgi:hypothetical protein